VPVTDREVCEALGVEFVERRPWPYASSSPMEELRVPATGERLLLKDLRAKPSARPIFLADTAREVDVYRDVLAELDVGAPSCRAAVRSDDAVFLVVELIDGVPLWQIGELEVWCDAARWLAAMHATDPPAAACLRRYDGVNLRLRLELGGIPADIATSVVDRLAALPPRLIHGELYPANVLVEHRSIRVVDWETAGLGPVPFDLAALVAGTWDDVSREAILTAYRDACPSELSPSDDDVLAARLVLAAQWCGWADSWTPPAEQQHDWRAEASSLLEQLSR
jgi:aminoglycoside phosphotransferase (APT) family kinase protein